MIHKTDRPWQGHDGLSRVRPGNYWPILSRRSLGDFSPYPQSAFFDLLAYYSRWTAEALVEGRRVVLSLRSGDVLTLPVRCQGELGRIGALVVNADSVLWPQAIASKNARGALGLIYLGGQGVPVVNPNFWYPVDQEATWEPAHYP